MKTKQHNITVTQTELVRLTGLSRERISAALAGVEPASTDRRTKRYALASALPAILHSGESQRERGERLKADILEIKKRRMEREQISYTAVKGAWTSVLCRIRDYILHTHLLSRAQAAELAKQLHAEITGADAEIEACVFAADGGDDEDGEEEAY
jgi:hypothetical protein